MSRAKFLKLGLFSLFLSIGACSNSPSARAPLPTPVNFDTGYDEEIQARRPEASRVGMGEGVKLSEALQKNLKKDSMSPERLKLISYLTQTRPHKNSFNQCQSKWNAPECVFLKDHWADSWFEEHTDESTSAPAHGRRKVRNNIVNALAKRLRKGDIERLPGQIEGDYYRAFKKLSSWTPELQELSDKILLKKECLNPELYTYLGLKGEESFPDERIFKSAIDLYSRADQCGLESPVLNKYVQISRFRSGLLRVMKDDCKTAESIFLRLAKMGTSDFSTRALYWNAYCARHESKKEEFLASFDELFKTNPLGFHTLSLSHGDSLLIENISKPIDPIVKSRTNHEGQLNIWIALIEDLDRLGNFEAIRHLLSPIRKTPEYLSSLEPGVRLYLGTFAYRASDTISLFRMLDSVFRTQSEYVVDATLRLFYPMNHFNIISANVKKVNPLLIAALIRQESAFQENAKSKVGAIGLMQLMPMTARLLDRKVRKKQLFDPEVNVRLGVKFFEALVDRYNGDVELALAAYNAGAEIVDSWKKRYPVNNRLLFLDLIPYAETRNYVTLIGRNYYWYSKIYADQLKQTPGGIAQTNEVEFRAMKSK